MRNLPIAQMAIDRRGVTAIEYGIIAGVLGLVLILAFRGYGTTLAKLFGAIGTSI